MCNNLDTVRREPYICPLLYTVYHNTKNCLINFLEIGLKQSIIMTNLLAHEIQNKLSMSNLICKIKN